MGRLAVIGGHSLLDSAFAVDASRVEVDVDVEGGSVTVVDAGQFVALQRHGLDQYRAAHAIDHAANLRAVAALGCDRVLAIGSVGSLHVDLGVGSFVAPDDYIALHLGLSLSDDAPGHQVRGFDKGVAERGPRRVACPRRRVARRWRRVLADHRTPLRDAR